MKVPETDFFSFIGVEETNFLVTLNKCHSDIHNMLPKIDGAFQTPMKHINISINDGHKITIQSLYLYIHGQLYISVVSFLRCHLSESLSSTRKAIDAMLTAYRLIEEPDTLKLYEESHSSYKSIKSYIQKARKNDTSRFPLADKLLKFHEVCSEFGSHADIATFIHKIAVSETDDPNQALMQIGMFQIPNSDDEIRRYIVETFLAFIGMLKVFASFIGSVATNFDSSEWEQFIDQLMATCYKEAERLDEVINAAQNVSTGH
jgi:hypothetical protein